MAGRSGWLCVSAIVALSASAAMAALIRPGGDPRPDRVIWADPFDYYSQWTADNQSNPAYQPRGTLWQGGPVPPGAVPPTPPPDLSGSMYPWKSPDGTGCGVQWEYAGFALTRTQWPINNCPDPIVTPAGLSATASDLWTEVDPGFVPGSNCTSGGWVETIGFYGRMNSIWVNDAGMHTSMGMVTHDLAPRIQSFQPRPANMFPEDHANPNAVNGSDNQPLTLIFYLNDSGTLDNPRAFVNNSYVELNLDDEHAPTDYIWRGDRNMPYPGTECCPEGPYPIICQQVREVNTGNYEQAADLLYLNDHCPSLVPPYDPDTQTGRTWPAIAFGFLAITCKDPCTCEEQGSGSHKPTMNHPLLFDGNKWRELRSGRGSALTTCTDVDVDWGPSDPVWGWALAGPEKRMQDSGTGACGNFSLKGGTHKVYLKLTTSRILIEMQTADGSYYCGAFDRIYQGPFNRIAWGVGPGCELKDKATEGDEYACKPGGTPTQCLTYSSYSVDGYWRNHIDAMSLLDGVLVQNTNERGCCLPNGDCTVTTQSLCMAQGGVFRRDTMTCEASTCIGACCRGEVSGCTDTTVNLCPSPFTFKGPGTRCATAVCPCSDPFADADLDGDVDQLDFAVFQDCFTGSGTFSLSPSCKCFDRENSGVGDQDVDVDDLAGFEACASGPGIPLNSACD